MEGSGRVTCHHVTLPDGGRAIVCTGRQRTRTCSCGRRATLQCDYPVGDRGRTCSAYVCERCATQVGIDRHHCGKHDAAMVQLEMIDG